MESSMRSRRAFDNTRFALAGIATVTMLTMALSIGNQASAADPAHDPELIAHLAETLAGTVVNRDRYDAQVWLFGAGDLLEFFIDDDALRLHILRTVYHESHQQLVDPALVLAVIEVESSFDPYAVSRSGAQGLMQVMPFWKRELGRSEDNLIKVDVNVRYGTAILAYYLQGSNGDLVRALSRYNGSEGRLEYPERVLKALRRRWQSTR
jgi:hypothetical protein